MIRHICPALLASALLATGLDAQIKPKDILIATTTAKSNESLISVTSTGSASNLTNYNRGQHHSVALDPNDPTAVFGLGGWPALSGPVGHYLLTKLSAAARGRGDGVVGVFGKTMRCHVYNDQLLFTIGTVSAGLYTRPRLGGRAKQLAKVPNAFDLTVVRDVAYVIGYDGATRKPILRFVELTAPFKTGPVTISPRSGSLGSAFRAVGSAGWEGDAVHVVVGDDNGKLWYIDPTKSTNNAYTTTAGSSRGEAVAIMPHADSNIGLVIATATGLYTQFAYNFGGKPFYTVPTGRTILDMTTLGGGLQAYGAGCAGKGGVPMHDVGPNGWPYAGNGRFTLRMDNAAASTNGALVIGAAKQNLDLTPLGAPKCYLYSNIMLQIGIRTDSAGKAALPTPIPNNPSVVGAKLLTQWGVFESGANAAGLVTTAGLELIIR